MLGSALGIGQGIASSALSAQQQRQSAFSVLQQIQSMPSANFNMDDLIDTQRKLIQDQLMIHSLPSEIFKTTAAETKADIERIEPGNIQYFKKEDKGKSFVKYISNAFSMILTPYVVEHLKDNPLGIPDPITDSTNIREWLQRKVDKWLDIDLKPKEVSL